MKNNNKNNNIFMIVMIAILVLALFGGYGMMGFGGGMMEGYYGFGWFFSIIMLIFTIWVVYDVLENNKNLSDGMKLLWIVCAILFSVITAIVYYLIGRNAKTDLFKNGNRQRRRR